MSLVTQASAAYADALARYYYTTQSLTMSAFASAGDALAQQRELHRALRSDRESTFDWKRNRRFLLKGLGCGIIWSLWYKIAEHWSEFIASGILSSVWKASIQQHSAEAILQTIASIVLEQCVAAPVIYACWDLPVLCLLNGQSVQRISTVVRQKLPSFLMAHFQLWTIVNVVIYTIPIHWRVLTQSFFEIIWEAMASTMTSSEEEGVHELQGSDSKTKIE